MAAMKRHNFDLIWRAGKSEESVGSRESLDEIEAHFSIDWSCTDELFGAPEIQKGP